MAAADETHRAEGDQLNHSEATSPAAMPAPVEGFSAAQSAAHAQPEKLLLGHNASTIGQLERNGLCELAWDTSTAMGPGPIADLLDQLAHRLYIAEED